MRTVPLVSDETWIWVFCRASASAPQTQEAFAVGVKTPQGPRVWGVGDAEGDVAQRESLATFAVNEAKLVLPPQARELLTFVDTLTAVSQAETDAEALNELIGATVRVVTFAAFASIGLEVVQPLVGLINDCFDPVPAPAGPGSAPATPQRVFTRRDLEQPAPPGTLPRPSDPPPAPEVDDMEPGPHRPDVAKPDDPGTEFELRGPAKRPWDDEDRWPGGSIGGL